MGRAQRLAFRTRRGMTLLELLVAMVILLVGIYTVARGFPVLLQTMRGEGSRTTLARLAEREMERFTRDPEGLPDAITGGGSISPYDTVEDFLEPTRPPNAAENVLDVIGEALRVPAAYIAPNGTYVAGTSGQYVLRQGPAQWTDPSGTSGMPYVYLLVPLTEQRDDPRDANSPGLASNRFYVDAGAGEILVPATVRTYDGPNARAWSVHEVVTDYAWTEEVAAGGLPPTHYVQGETVNDITTGATVHVGRVHPAHLSATVFGQLAPGQTRVWAKHYFAREAWGTAYPTAPGRYVLENNYGATLRFHPQDTGLTLKADYRLKHDTTAEQRRMLMMMEEQVVPATRQRVDGGGVGYTDIRLSLRHIDPGTDPAEGRLFANNSRGVALGPGLQSNVLAVDLLTGATYIEGVNFALVDATLSPALEDGYGDGVLALPLEIAGAPAPYIGHTMRFYYRTLDRHNLQLQKAPRAFVDRRTAEAYQAAYLGYLGGPAVAQAAEAASLAEVDYRTYDLTLAPSPGDPNLRLGTLEFGQWMDEDADGSTPPIWSEARNCAGMTVAVNYSYYTGSPAQLRFVYGELHTIPDEGSRIVLNHATLADGTGSSWDDYPITIMAVNGVSARSRAWWLNDKGLQKYLDIESCFLPTALGLLPRVQ